MTVLSDTIRRHCAQRRIHSKEMLELQSKNQDLEWVNNLSYTHIVESCAYV